MNKLYLDWNKLNQYVADIAQQISVSAWAPNYIVGISRGGTTPAAMLSHYMNIPMFSLNVSLRDNGFQESNCWMAEDAIGYSESMVDIWARKKILIVDDINDSGDTFSWIQKDWQSSVLPKDPTWQEHIWHNSVRFACLVENTASKESADYSALQINKIEKDVWVVFPWEEWWK